MSGFSDVELYSYAKFLVEIVPGEAIDILCNTSLCNPTEIEKRVDRACVKLGKGNKHQIKGLILERQYDTLRSMAPGAISHPSPSILGLGGPLRYSQTPPPSTPSTTARQSPRLSRAPGFEYITVLYGNEEFRISTRASGSDANLIKEDTLDRFDGLIPTLSQPEKITVGGVIITVGQFVRLTWSRAHSVGTDCTRFWVVGSDQIRDADALLGYKRPGSRRDKGAEGSPQYSQDHTMRPSHVPTPTQPPNEFYEASSADNIYSHDGATNFSHHYGIPSGNHHLPHAPRPSVRTAPTMASGPPPPPLFNTMPSQSRPDPEVPRSPSVQSVKTTTNSGSDILMVRLSFKGHGKRLVRLDISMKEDAVWPFLEPHLSKLSGEESLNRSLYEMKVTPLKGGAGAEPQDCQLNEDDFEFFWGEMVSFFQEHRSPESSKTVEFLLDIG